MAQEVIIDKSQACGLFLDSYVNHALTGDSKKKSGRGTEGK